MSDDKHVITLSGEEYMALQLALDEPERDLINLKKMLASPSVFEMGPDDKATIKAQAKTIVALADQLSKLLETTRVMMLWPFNLKHASDGQYETFLDNQYEQERSDFNCRKELTQHAEAIEQARKELEG